MSWQNAQDWLPVTCVTYVRHFWVFGLGKTAWTLLFGQVLINFWDSWSFWLSLFITTTYFSDLFTYLIALCHFLHSLPTPTDTSTEVSLSQNWALGVCCPLLHPLLTWGNGTGLGTSQGTVFIWLRIFKPSSCLTLSRTFPTSTRYCEDPIA